MSVTGRARATRARLEARLRVISTGLYAYVRHPMYASAVLLIFAMPIGLGFLWGLLAATIVPPLRIALILEEERVLSAELRAFERRLMEALQHESQSK